MSLLQIKKLEAPEQICRSSLFSGSARSEGSDSNPTESSESTATATATEISNYDSRDEGIFTCHFSRPTVETDYTKPKDSNETASFTVKVFIYDNRYKLIAESTLNIAQSDDPKIEIVRFRLVISNFTYEQYGGCNIYVHVVIDNNAENAQNVSFRENFSDNYHETIKGVYLYDEKSIESVYWSKQYYFPATGESEVRSEITLNEDAYIHVRTSGISGETVHVSIYEKEEKELGNTKALASIKAPIQYNRKVLIVSMKCLLSNYYSINEKEYDENNPPSLKFYVHVEYEPNGVEHTTLKKDSKELLLNINSEPLNTDTSCNGTVFFENKDSDMNLIDPDRYRDFQIGYICHIEGVGKLAKAYDNETEINDVKNAKYTIYPFYVYKIMLSDLVECGLITLDEAAYLTTEKHDIKTLLKKEDLENDFDKINDELDKNEHEDSKEIHKKLKLDKTPEGKLLLSLFLDSKNDYLSKSSAIRKVLAQVSPKYKDKETEFSDQKFICRDAWEITSSVSVDTTEVKDEKQPNGTIKTIEIKSEGRKVTRIYPREDDKRYSQFKECPFGDFFLNYLPGTFKVYVSRNIDNKKINRYEENKQIGRSESPNHIQRENIALHLGGSIYSTGCLTFNTRWGNGYFTDFINFIYEKEDNINKLNFICIDERNAIKIANDTVKYTGNDLDVIDDSTKTKQTITLKKHKDNEEGINFNRYYDLVKPPEEVNKIPIIIVTKKEIEKEKE